MVKAKESTVFQYQALARGQRFAAVIVADDTTDLSEIENLLKHGDLLYLGRSRSATYGQVHIESIERKEWHESQPADQPLITLTLLSDAILRDVFGQPTHDLDGYLSSRLKKPLIHQKAFMRSIETGGFNRKWKLPLPQMPTLGMGSVFVYSAKDISLKELEGLAESGIGERRAEGFGRIAINWPGKETFKLAEEKKPEPSPDKPLLSATSRKLAASMSERLLRHIRSKPDCGIQPLYLQGQYNQSPIGTAAQCSAAGY